MKRMSSERPKLKSSWCVGFLSTAVAMWQLVVLAVAVAAGVMVIVVVLVVLALFIYRSHECSVMQTCYHRGRSAGC
jgi:uncharacterized protein (DUF983 family)